MDPTTFTQLFLESFIKGLKTALTIGWNALLTHPWLLVLVAGGLALSVISRFTRRLPRPRRRYR